MDEHTHKAGRLMWAKLNAYGIILAGLTTLGATDLIRPAGANLAILVGSVPPGQVFWVSGIVVSGLLLMFGFIRNDRLAESLGLVLLFSSLSLQTVVAMFYLGYHEFVVTRLLILGLIGFAGWARISALWSKDGMVITIPPRRGT